MYTHSANTVQAEKPKPMFCSSAQLKQVDSSTIQLYIIYNIAF